MKPWAQTLGLLLFLAWLPGASAQQIPSNDITVERTPVENRSLLISAPTGVPLQDEKERPTIARKIPPAGVPLPEASRQSLEGEIERIRKQLQKLSSEADHADIEVLLKAVTFAIELDEFYSPIDLGKANALLEMAADRAQSLKNQQRPWESEKGRVVRGYYSSIDGSPQPYVLEIPDSWDPSRPSPLFVWLHGRGDKTTDLHFIYQRMKSPGTLRVDNALVVHPFGRHCMGFKSAGEVDVLEVVEQVQRQYSIDPDRIVLMGFSMGGAGVWHLGAHYTDRWVAMSPGAGFAETAQYNRLTPDRYPADIEQTLWKVYDCPNYARNLLNLPVVAYSGEKDKQIQAARVMESALAREGHTLKHIIGPGMGHKYHPDSLAEILRQMNEAVNQGLDRQPSRLTFQTPTLRYSKIHGFQISGLREHWVDSRLNVRYQDGAAQFETKNVTEFIVTDPRPLEKVDIDGQEVGISGNDQTLVFHRDANDQWHHGPLPYSGLRKRPGLQGPIDDAWLRPFLVVKPSGKPSNAQVASWVNFELEHFQDRWQALFRGTLPVKFDTEVTQEDLENKHLILWGDPQSNAIIRRIMPQLPFHWDAKKVMLGDDVYNAENCVPVMIYPNPESPNRYLVLNSGPTFREGHDRTNSLQNPKLPDWAIVNLETPPNDTAPGAIKASGFFDEQWKLQPQVAKSKVD